MDTIEDLIIRINRWIDTSSLGIRTAYINLRSNTENPTPSPALLAYALLVMTKQTQVDEVELGARMAVKACRQIDNLDPLVRLQVAYHLADAHKPPTDLEAYQRASAPQGAYLPPIIREVAERSARLLESLLSRGEFDRTHPSIALKCHEAIVHVFGNNSDSGRKAMQGMFDIIRNPDAEVEPDVKRLALYFLQAQVEKYSNLHLEMRAWAAAAIKPDGVRSTGAEDAKSMPSTAVVFLDAFRKPGAISSRAVRQP